jgi:hypothetical protein
MTRAPDFGSFSDVNRQKTLAVSRASTARQQLCRKSRAIIAALAVVIGLSAGAFASVPSAGSATQAFGAFTETIRLPESAAPSHAAPVLQSQTAPAPAAGAPPSAATDNDTDESAWRTASGVATRESYAQYLKSHNDGQHVQEAQLAIASLILTAPATGKKFDGKWDTTWTCPNLGQYPGYTFQFTGQVTDGLYHGVRGKAGQPSSLVLDGRIEEDGAAAFTGEIIVGSSVVGLGAARGTPSDFHALATFTNSTANGRRIEGRACILTLQRR